MGLLTFLYFLCIWLGGNLKRVVYYFEEGRVVHYFVEPCLYYLLLLMISMCAIFIFVIPMHHIILYQVPHHLFQSIYISLKRSSSALDPSAASPAVDANSSSRKSKRAKPFITSRCIFLAVSNDVELADCFFNPGVRSLGHCASLGHENVWSKVDILTMKTAIENGMLDDDGGIPFGELQVTSEMFLTRFSDCMFVVLWRSWWGTLKRGM